jgi:hypothetical protein
MKQFRTSSGCTRKVIAFNTELGRDICPKEQLVRSQHVTNRSILRGICDVSSSLSGVETDKIPAEYYEPDFCPGMAPATSDAMRVLRPLGWVPVFDVDKVYLRLMYRLFTEEDAVARLEAHERKDEQDEEDLLAEFNQEVPESESRAIPCTKEYTDIRTATFPATASAPQWSSEVYSSPHLAHLKLRLPQKVVSATEARTLTPPKKHHTLQVSTELDTPSPPPFEARFAKYNEMTEEIYDELDDDNKMDFIKIFVQGGNT